MQYMLDTNICIAIIKRHPLEVQERLSKIPVGEVGISSIVLAELWYGVSLSQKQRHNERALKDFLKYVVVSDWPEVAAPHYGRIRVLLKKRGQMIGANDLLIAAHALTLDSVLVTDNLREFQRIPHLKVENWITR